MDNMKIFPSIPWKIIIKIIKESVNPPIKVIVSTDHFPFDILNARAAAENIADIPSKQGANEKLTTHKTLRQP